MTLDQLQLSSVEKTAIEEASRTLKSGLPIGGVILFGSKTRGNACAQSDIDLLILTSGPVAPELRRKVSESLARINLEYDVALTAVIVSEKDWSEGLIHYTQLYQEVQRDGCLV